MRCPICSRDVPMCGDLTSPVPGAGFPFCSDRCRLIDLGRWLDGKYQIPVDHDEAAVGESSDVTDDSESKSRSLNPRRDESPFSQ